MKCNDGCNDGLKIGDTVILNSGGPKMTVNSLSNSSVGCIWFREDGTVGNWEFSEKLITKK